MKRLIFDVSTNVMYVGLIEYEDLVDFSIRYAQRDHAKYLVDRIDQLLRRNQITISEVDEIIIGHGPGSYTGLRIAVMVAKMLGYTKDIPVKTISSLLFMTSGYEQKVAAMIDARRGNVFSAVYHQGKTILEDALRSLDDFRKEKAYQEAETVFINDDTYKINPLIIINHAIPVTNIHDLVPNYLRKTEAEMTYDQKSKNK